MARLPWAAHLRDHRTRVIVRINDVVIANQPVAFVPIQPGEFRGGAVPRIRIEDEMKFLLVLL
jgi:hypothetical protein